MDSHIVIMSYYRDYRETGIVDDGRTIVDSQQVSRRVQQSGTEAVQVQHELGPRKYTH